MRSFIVNLASAAVGVVVGAVLVLGIIAPQIGGMPRLEPLVEAQRSSAQAAQLPAVTDLESQLADIYQRVSPAVVHVTNATARRTTGSIVPRGTGSGFIIDTDGHILTNYHVISGADRIIVILADNSEYTAQVRGTDPYNDIALLKIDAPREKLTVAPLGDSDTVQEGHLAIAIGNPFGLDRTMTLGIVSARRSRSEGPRGFPILGMIQTDAAINPGNSGGPLLNSRGEVIGINTAIEGPVQANVGIGFAVPINTVKRELDDLKAGRQIRHAWLGIGGRAVTESLASELKLPVKQGVLVVEVSSGGPAAQAGLRGSTLGSDGTIQSPGDVITAIDGRQVTSVEDIAAYLATKRPGDRVKLDIIREGRTMSIDVMLGERPSQLARQQDTNPPRRPELPFRLPFPFGQ